MQEDRGNQAPELPLHDQVVDLHPKGGHQVVSKKIPARSLQEEDDDGDDQQGISDQGFLARRLYQHAPF